MKKYINLFMILIILLTTKQNVFAWGIESVTINESLESLYVPTGNVFHLSSTTYKKEYASKNIDINNNFLYKVEIERLNEKEISYFSFCATGVDQKGINFTNSGAAIKENSKGEIEFSWDSNRSKLIAYYKYGSNSVIMSGWSGGDVTRGNVTINISNYGEAIGGNPINTFELNNMSVKITEMELDKDPPVITIGDYVKTPTNKDITVTATANKGTLNKISHTFTANGSFEFIATDNAGNVTKKTVTITNIDKTAPTTPTLKADVTTPTNKDVTVTVTAGTDAGSGVDKTEYKIGSGGTWTAYTVPFKVNSNNTVYARTIDKAGNISAEGSLVVSNIDKTPPVINIVPNKTEWTNGSIILNVSATDNSSVKRIRLKDGNWINGGYMNYEVTINGTYIFEAEDSSDNLSNKSININNIDKTKPKLNIKIK